MILCDPGQNPVCDPSHDPFVVRAMNCDVKAINLFFSDPVWFLCSGVIMVQFVVMIQLLLSVVWIVFFHEVIIHFFPKSRILF